MRLFWTTNQKFEFFRSFQFRKKLFSSLKGTPSGISRQCKITEKFQNSFSLNISNTLVFLNLERGADLGSSRLVWIVLVLLTIDWPELEALRNIESD